MRSTGLACAGFLLAAASCGPQQASRGNDDSAAVPAEPRFGGTVVFAGNADVEDLNPLTIRSTMASQIVRELLFVPLLRMDARLQPAPALARSWEVSPDSSQLTFRLRDDVSWHDGRPVTAEDVKFTYDLARDPKTAAVNTALWTYFGAMEVVDPHTVRVAMRPHADFLAGWTFFLPVPRHLLAGVAPEKLRRHPFSTTRPVGNGPFRAQRRTIGEGWSFVANERFPSGLGGRPYLDRLVFRAIPEANTALVELLTGRVDYLVGVGPDQQARVRASDRTRLVAYRMPGYTHITWNGRRPLFRDARVRRALTLAIDRQEIIDGLLLGNADLAATTVSPMLWNYDPAAGAALRHDPGAAARLLAEAGWRDRNGDGVLEDARGREFRFTLSGNRGSMTGEQILEKIQADLRRVGVVAEVRLEDFNTLLARIQDPASRDFDAVLTTRTTGFRIDDRDSFHCDRMDKAYQTAGFCDPEVDRLLDTLPLIADREAARPLWQAYQRRIAEAQPYTFLYHPHSMVGVGRRLQNVHPDARGALVDAARWWVLPTQPAATR